MREESIDPEYLPEHDELIEDERDDEEYEDEEYDDEGYGYEDDEEDAESESPTFFQKQFSLRSRVIILTFVAVWSLAVLSVSVLQISEWDGALALTSMIAAILGVTPFFVIFLPTCILIPRWPFVFRLPVFTASAALTATATFTLWWLAFGHPIDGWLIAQVTFIAFVTYIGFSLVIWATKIK